METNNSVDPILHKIYDPESFRKTGHELIDHLADYLQAMSQRPATPVMPYLSPDQAREYWQDDWDQEEGGEPVDLFRKILRTGIHLHHPHYAGHQISPAAPVAALAGLVNDFLNNGMGIYEMGIPGTVLEHLVVKMTAQAMGFGPEADGVLTSGGTLANLTALLTARAVKAEERVWEAGSRQPYALLVSEEAHYCVDRAVRIMGWGSEGIIKVPVNERFEMRTELLPGYWEQAVAAGKKVLAVVGSACSTSTGSFDDLTAIAQFCREKDLWFHIDGAHGAACVYSSKYRRLVAGLELADSVAMDFHKMCMVPALGTALVYREGKNSYRTFAQKAQYLWNRQEEEEWHNLAKRTFECTKHMIGLRVYSLLRTYGTEGLEAYVTRVNDLGGLFGELIAAHPDFELALVPRCNIVCFRYAPEGQPEAVLEQVNQEIRERLVREHTFYIVRTVLQERTFLRTTLTNALTTREDLEELLRLLATLGRDFLSAGS